MTLQPISRSIDAQLNDFAASATSTNLLVTNPFQVFPNQITSQVSFFNNVRYNKSMISLTGSILLFILIVTLFCVVKYLSYAVDDYDFSLKIISFYILLFCVSTIPTSLYFILNPNHLVIALKELQLLK